MSDNKLSKNEKIKEESNYLRGTIAEALVDGTNRFSEENNQVLKFHGTYQQDDRDLRRQLTKEGKERHYMMMIRARIPAGILNAEQYLQFDRIADTYGNGTMRITTRQTFQLHGVLKHDLKSTIREINDVLITTLGGCGDQVRNIVTCGQPHTGPFYDAVQSDLMAVVDALSAKTSAYHEIWLDGEKVNLDETDSEEPIYGKAYLPRKFKLAFAYEGDNCADIYSNDIGIVAHQSGDEVAGYTLVIGGGMGRTASDKNTHPLLAQPFCFVSPDELVATCTAILLVQRDHGNRSERKFARMKYLVEAKGLQWFREEVEARLGKALTPPRELHWDSAKDHLGHGHQEDGSAYLGIFVENGRLHDTETLQLKTVLREVIREFQPQIRMTTQQNIILAGLSDDAAKRIAERLQAAGVVLPQALSSVRLNSMACVAMPTCGLAIAESERVLPKVIGQFEQTLASLGLAEEPISVRMTGCPNGCARPYIAEIGFVGRVLGKYDVFLGAAADGTRMNELFKEQVPLEDLVSAVTPVLQSYQANRTTGESFGAYCHRVGVERLRDLTEISG